MDVHLEAVDAMGTLVPWDGDGSPLRRYGVSF